MFKKFFQVASMKYLFFLFSAFTSFNTVSQTVASLNLVPVPVELRMKEGFFTFDKSTVIVAPGLRKKDAAFLNSYISNQFGFELDVSDSIPTETTPNLLMLSVSDSGKKEGYILDISTNTIRINGMNDAGLFYGIQTLIQLFPMNQKLLESKSRNMVKRQREIPQVYIVDYPRFGYRGMHLDVSRHFFDVDFIKKYIDYLAWHKFNTFHWHLTDDQGWRIEIKKYPLLTSVGGWRNGTIIGRYPGTGNDNTRYGGFYSQDEIRDVVRYASDRYITIIPEIELPGHASAAIAAYPQLSCFPDESTKIPPQSAFSGNTKGKQVQQTWGVFEDVFCPTDFTFKFLENVLAEVIDLFPSKYIHIGGDECPKDSWKRSEFCQKLIKNKKLKDEHELQGYFMQRMEKYLNSKGRLIIGWDEILEGGVPTNATVMSWRGENGGIQSAKAGHDAIMTPQSPCYFDHTQTRNEDSVVFGGFNPVEKVYSYEPVPKQLEAAKAKYILGSQANVWTEYITNPGKVEYMIFPRMSALSEVLWSPKENRNWDDFQKRLPALMMRYRSWDAHYSNAYYDLQATIIPTDDYKGVKWKLESKNKDGRIVYVKGKMVSASQNYDAPILITKNSEYGAALAGKDRKIVSNWVWQKLAFNKATGKKITLKTPPSPNYPGSGAFTLVNGVITERKLSQAPEWLGFLGKDLEAEIDLGEQTWIDSISVNVLDQNGSWIYLPSSITIKVSDGITPGNDRTVSTTSTPAAGTRKITLPFHGKYRYVNVTVKNYGIIPTGQPGAGTGAWLFVDEIEVN